MNEIIKVSKSHYMAYSTMKRKYTRLVSLQAGNLPKVERADFEITWYCRDRRKDKDNITGGGTKVLLDGLVEAGVLENDGWKQIGNITHLFEIDKEHPRIEVKIISLGDE